MTERTSFGVIGIDHPHVFGQVDCLLAAGAAFASFFAADDALAAPFAARYPQARWVRDRRAVLEDDRLALIVTAAVPGDRAEIALAAMRHGRDVMSDKPGMVTLGELAELRRVQAETGRIYSIMYSEHFETRATVRAGELVAAGAIGAVLQTTGLGPHAIHNTQRPDWFFQRACYGGILADIASHQCEQFLFFSGADEGRVLSATVANRAHPDRPGLQDIGDMHLATELTTGYVRVDWFTPKGLPVWGDGRLTILGSEGYIELRKYIDIAGRPGGDHLLLVDEAAARRIDCCDVALPYGPALLADISDRTETAMPQARCFGAMELALSAQAMAEARSGPRPAG